MTDVLARAVRNRQQIPGDTLRITVNRGTMREEVVRMEPAVFEQARELAWQAHEPHNQAREIFIEQVIDVMSRRVGR